MKGAVTTDHIRDARAKVCAELKDIDRALETVNQARQIRPPAARNAVVGVVQIRLDWIRQVDR